MAIQVNLTKGASKASLEDAILLAKGYSDEAETRAADASTSAANANLSQASALSSKNSASASATAAQLSEGVASSQATISTEQAAISTAQAVISANEATDSANSASLASISEGNALSSATAAATSEANASSSEETAIAQADIAVGAASEASTSETNASVSETNAATSATSASNSASSASSSASTATTQASTATTQAGIATTQASNASASATAASNSATASANSATSASGYATSAETSATTATTQAGIATTKASEALASATSAANDLATFQGQYTSSTIEPSSPTEGDLWFDEANDLMKVYNGSIWQLAGSSVNGTSERHNYTATSGQTTFNATYDVGFVDVYLNGIKLQDTVDFTATNGSSVILASGANSGDIIDIVAYGTFSVADTYTQTATDNLLDTKVSKTDNETIAGTKTFSSFPVTPSAEPSSDYQVANKKYVDDNSGADIASTAEAQAGTNNTNMITPLRLHEAIFGGVEQSLQDVTASRALSTTFTNSTGRTIMALVTFRNGAVNVNGIQPSLYVDGVKLWDFYFTNGTSEWDYPSFTGIIIIPNGATYKAECGNGSINKWYELR